MSMDSHHGAATTAQNGAHSEEELLNTYTEELVCRELEDVVARRPCGL